MVSEPFFYDQLASSQFLVNSAAGNGFNPNVSVQLSLDATQTTAYHFSFPPSLPSSRQPLFVSPDGSSSTGFPTTLSLINALLSGTLTAASVTSPSVIVSSTTTSGVSTTLLTSPTQSASYTLYLPSILPSSGSQPLYVSSSGQISTGFPTTVNLVNLSATGSVTASTIIGTQSLTSTSLYIQQSAGSVNPNVQIVAASGQTASYVLTLPTLLPAANAPLYVNSAGVLSFGYPDTVNMKALTLTAALMGVIATFSTSITSPSFILPITASSSIGVTLSANSSQSSSYRLTFPIQLPSASAAQPLFVDSTGQITTGFPNSVIIPTSVTTAALQLTSTSGSTLSLNASATQGSNYSITFPGSLPSSSQPLFIDNSGRLSTGFPTTVLLTNLSATGSITANNASVSTLSLPVSSGSSISTSLNANANTTASYSLTLPLSLPTSNQPLFVDSGGNLTTGFPSTVTFTNANVTGTLNAALLSFPSASSNPATSISIKAPSGVASNYTLTLPSALPTSSQALLSDTSGNLSWGTVASGGGSGGGGSTGTSTQTTFTSFSATSPQSTAATVSGLQFTQVGVLQVYVNVAATTNLGAVYMLTAYQVSGQWSLSYSYESSDDTDTGVDFQINASSGQVTYTSPSFVGWTSTTFTWPSLTNASTSGSLSVTYPALKVAGTPSGADLTVSAGGSIIFTNVLYDTVSMYSTSTGQSTIKVAGIYLIQAQLYLTNTSAGILQAAVNGTVVGYLWQENTVADAQWKGTCIISVKQGDVITLTSSSNITVFNGNAQTSQWSLTMVSPVAASGILLAQSAASGRPSATQGAFFSVGGPTFTDTLTAASGSAAGFSSTYIAAPTIAAQNTNVTTTNASTLTIAGSPIAGTNETITNAFALNVQSGPAYFGGNVTLNGTTSSKTPFVISNHPYGAFVTNIGSANFTNAPFQFTYVSGNMGTTLNQTVGIPITITGLYMITHGFEASNVTEYVIYTGTDQGSANRLLNRYNNGAAFPDSRHSYSVVGYIAAPNTLNAYLTTNASTAVTNTYSKGMVVSLIARTV